MAKLCAEDCISMTPYSALAGGRLSKHPGETSKRLQEDSYARLKYDGTAAQDREIIDRVAELAEKHGVSMTEISLAWLLTKVTSPVVGVTKLPQIEGAVKAVDLSLSQEELTYLEEPYVPHRLVGVMAQKYSGLFQRRTRMVNRKSKNLKMEERIMSRVEQTKQNQKNWFRGQSFWRMILTRNLKRSLSGSCVRDFALRFTLRCGKNRSFVSQR